MLQSAIKTKLPLYMQAIKRQQKDILINRILVQKSSKTVPTHQKRQISLIKNPHSLWGFS
ncbi:hypothetical protein B5J92_02115 [Moraxella atlantae]|nr:hypothetical protein B5J92_02115 [Moraxella atlantae]